MDLPRILERNVREARQRLGLSQEQLALDTEMKRSYLSDLERGTRNPSAKAIARLAVSLGVEPWTLLVEPGDDGPANSPTPRAR